MENTLSPIDYARMGCDTLMKKFSADTLPPAGLFHYHQGVFLSGMEKTLAHTGERKYADYIKSWVDGIISPDGEITNYVKERLDDLQPGILLYRLFDETGDKRYEKPLHTIYGHLKNWPRNQHGGFWHKYEHPNQMWLDGLYMAGPFLAMYGARFGEERCFDEVYTQAKIMWDNNRNRETNLLCHAWDESRAESWADPITGRSPECWGRALGWYIVALVTVLDYFPDDYPHRSEMIDIIRTYAAAIARYRDEKTGLWYQVTDKPDGEGNWLETSCSSLFVAGIASAVARGYLGKEYADIARRGFEGLISVISADGDGGITVPDICIGTGVGDYDFYIHRPVVENDLHGMGAFVIACCEYYDMIMKGSE